MYIADFVNDRYHISEAALSRFPIPSATFSDVVKTHEQFVYAADLVPLQEELIELSTSDRTDHNMQYRWLGKDGQPIWINCRGKVVTIDGVPTYLIGCINEIGAKPKADNQSGLLRLGGSNSLPQEIAASEFNGFVLRIGVDDLRGINAKNGTRDGDTTIAFTAESILASLSEGQYVYRIDGDEFLILSMKEGNFDDALNLYRTIRTAIVQKIRTSNYKILFTVSAGIVTSTDIEDCSFDFIMKSSQHALAIAKSYGKNAYARFDLDQYNFALEQHNLGRILRDAVENDFDGFDVNYQILVSQDNGIIGAESLMRYTRPDGTVVSPMKFIPILEDTGLIIPTGRWILKQAMIAGKKAQEYIPEFVTTVNVSYVQISRTDLASDVEAILKEVGFNPANLVIELTESGFLESDIHYENSWRKLKALGVKMALDDFGTGYSNFHYLNELRPDIVKIDRSFTVSALKDEYEFQILNNMRHLSANLDLNMCVEGVETQEDLDRINMIHPEYIQGYFFGKPGPVDDLINRVKTSKNI